MWDPKKARDRIEEERQIPPEELEIAKRAAEDASSGRKGTQLRELFETKANMRGAMQVMDLTNGAFQQAFRDCEGVDDEVTCSAVALGMMLNLVLILRVINQTPMEILDSCSRAVELSELFKEAMLDAGGHSPYDAKER